jgi:hypothetical protein
LAWVSASEQAWVSELESGLALASGTVLGSAVPGSESEQAESEPALLECSTSKFERVPPWQSLT